MGEGHGGAKKCEGGKDLVAAATEGKGQKIQNNNQLVVGELRGGPRQGLLDHKSFRLEADSPLPSPDGDDINATTKLSVGAAKIFGDVRERIEMAWRGA